MKNQWVLGTLGIAVLAVTSIIISGRGVQADVQTAPRVESVRAPAATLVVTSTADSGAGTLRWALQTAVAGDTITFDPTIFPPTSPVTIALTSGPLSDITQGNLTIDASSTGVILNGSALSEGDGFHITSDWNVIQGLQILYFPGDGVYIGGGAQYNTIGGDNAGERNVISGNGFAQVQIEGAGTDYNVVSSNYIGTDASGLRGLGGGYGVRVEFGAQHNVVGGITPGERNLVSGNGADGVVVNQSGTMSNTVVGNFIGTDATGTVALSNGWSGVAFGFGSQYNRVRGNVISGNHEHGVKIFATGTIYNVISGNYIGTDVNGTTAISNTDDGVCIEGGASNNFIGGSNATPGGTCTGDCNLISGNGGSAVVIVGSGTVSNIVSSNYIGTDAHGTAALGNRGNGVTIGEGAQHNVIGGDTEGERNIVTSNRGNGISIWGSGTMSNTISGNLIGLDLDGTVDRHAQALAISPGYATDATIFVGTEEHGVFKSINGGSSWVAVNIGLTTSNVQALAISPNYTTDQTIFAGTASGGIFKSTDGGGSWVAVNTGLDEMNVRTLAISPNYGVERTIFAGTNGGIFRSTNGGSNWSAMNSGLTDLNVSALAISPDFATDQTIFASTWGGGVFKSTDTSLNWVAANNGLTTLQISALDISPNYTADQTLFAGNSEGSVFKSTNGGGSWVSTSFSADLTDVGAIKALAVSPDYATDQTVFVSTCEGTHYVSKSTDGGSTWADVNSGLSNTDHIGVLALSPNYATDQTVFLSAFWNGVFRSDDGGSNWVPANNGLTELGNYGGGVCISGGAKGNTIGGGTSGRRNVISNNSGAGIYIGGAGTDHNIIIGNYIGTDATGSTNLGNGWYGVGIENGAQRNVIGGTTTGKRNVISGNYLTGIDILGDGTMNNVVIGNFIGTDVTGSAALGNGRGGVGINDWGGGAQQNRIGGTTEEERNIISGNDGDGVRIEGSNTISNIVSGNYIGTDATGTLPLGNDGDGVRIERGARHNVVGGDSPEERNVVSGNSLSGVSIGDGATENVVIGNYIGTDVNGMAPVGNGQAGDQAGVAIYEGATRNRIERNVISGNNVVGVSIDWGLDSDDNVVIGNYIGTDATGTGALGNTFAGIFVADNASDNIIGGSTAAEENIIAYNGVYGVYIRDTATIRNTITHNSIHSNADKGIKLSDGGNTELAPPIVTQLDLNAGTMTGMACPGCTVEIFSDSNDEGEVYEGQTRANSAGAFAFDKGSLLTGPHVNTTATDAAGNTSEFSVGVRQVTPLALGNPLEDSVESLAYSDYVLEIGAGERLLAEVTPLNGVGQIWLYGQVDHMPSQARYDFRATQPTVQGTYELLVAPTRVGTYYFSVFGWDITAEQATYTIVARAVDQYLSDVQPRSAGNAGDVTLNVQGLGLVDGLDVELRRSGSPTLVADDVMQLSSTGTSAHFDLTGVDAGVYDVVAIWPDTAEKELEGAFEVLTSGVGSQLEASLEAPEFVRPDRTFVLWLDYANTGDAEMVAPLFVISSTQGVPMRLAEQEPFEHRALQILGGNTDGLAGTLPPGTSGRIPIYLHVPADTGAHEMLDFDLAIMISDTLPIDWDEVEDEVRPPDVDPEVWDVLWPSLTAQIGDTWGDYRQALADNASYLSTLGRTAYSVRELFRFEVRKALGMNPRTVLAGRLDAYVPAPGMPLQFGRVFPGSLEGRFYLGPLGRGWSHSYDIYLEEQSGGDIVIHWPDSFTRVFRSEDGTYAALPGDYGTLTREGDIFELTEKDGTVYRFRADRKLDYIEDPNGNRITAVYDGGGRLIEIQHSSGDSFALEYNAHGRISQLTDHANRTTEYSYDATGEHLLTVTAPGSRVTTYSYNSASGQPTNHALLSIAYPDGTHQYYAYEGLGRLSEEHLDGGDERISYTYDASGRIHVADASGETAIISPDEHGRPARMRDALGRDLGQEYSPDFNLVQMMDPAGQPYKFDYDHLGNVIGTENPLGHQVRLGYDTRFSKVASLEDARGNRSTFEYDDAGNLTTLTYPDDSQESFAYDVLGNPVSYISRGGDVVTYTHDARGQLLRKDYPDGSWVTYTYDVAGNVTSASDVSGTVTMEYDEDTNLLTRITYPSGHYFEYSYNDAGQRVQRLDQNGHELNYEYDAAGRLSRLYDEHGADIISYEYDAIGRLSKESKGNGTYTTYVYDEAGQLLSIVNYAPDDTVQSRFDYTYDANGNRTSMTTLDGTTTYEYDLIGQLTGVTYPDGRHVTYEYDTAGNRITVTDDGAATDYTTNSLNQYTRVSDATYTYDANGNMTSKTDASGTTIYEYDFENRLIRVTTPISGTWEYTYDALGNRVAVEHDGVVTRYVHDPIGLVDVAAEYDGGSSLVARYVHGLGLVARIGAASDSAYYAFDATGHTRQLTDDTGAVVNTYDYSPFGIPLQVDETIPNSCRYVGRFGVIEEGNGLIFMRARHYDSPIGRFTAVDPINIAGGVNLYSYVRNNPVSGQDPMGLARRGWMYWVPEIAKDILGSIQEALEEAGLYGLPFNLEGVGELAELAGRNWGDFGSVSWDELSVAAQHTLGEVGDLVKFLSYDVPYWWFTRNIDQTSIPADLGNSDLPSNTTEQISADSTENIRPDDPNEKVGPAGSGEQHLVSADDELHYVIYFENKPEAGAPAQEVSVTDILDPDLDWSTFRLTEIAWGDHIIAAPEDTVEFFTRETVKDYREEAEKSWWVDVQVALNYASGRVRWTFRTVDPGTGALPLDALAGFLPPNDETGRGEGHVAFTIRPRADAPDGVVLSNEASIIFDTNDPIVTNKVTNMIGQPKLYLPLVLRNYTPVAFPLHIGDAIPERPVAYQGETFYVKSVRIPDELSPSGHYYFSSQRDTVAKALVDDALVVLLDGTEVFAYDFSTGGLPTPAVVEVPRTVIEGLAGETVTVEYRDVHAGVVRADPMWLIEVPEEHQ